MNTAGVILDFYDDVAGSLVKQANASLGSPGELATTLGDFHFLTPEEHEVLRDEAYALVMQDEGKVFRKFACVDEGNTALSVLYFMQNWDKLPPEAVKVAAANLEEWCGEYEIPVPHFLKLAKVSGMSRTRDSVRQPIVGEDADWAQRTNLASIQGGADSGRVIPTASQMKTASQTKTAGRAFQQAKHYANQTKQYVKGAIDQVKQNAPTILATGGLATLGSRHALKLHDEKKKKHASVVDVSGQAPEVQVKRASAENTALGGKFPLDAMADVAKAIEWFDNSYKAMDPVEAHIFAVKTASRAEELGLPVSDALERYGSTTYARDVDAHLANRLAVTDPEFAELYTELREKRAQMEPIEFATLLSEVDELSGAKWAWGGEVADPFYATFGKAKTASAWSWQSRVGDFVNDEDLQNLARNGKGLLLKQFASDLVHGFIKDPIAVFDSLPDDTKVILARMAAGRNDGLATN